MVDEYAETMNFSGIKTINRLDDSDSEDSESEDGGNADPKKKRVIRNGAEDRRKSLARRVSFAPNAFIRFVLLLS